jgi:hypothetical protein
MSAKGIIGLALLAAFSLAGSGCMTGSGLEVGAYGSTMDADDLGTGYGGGAKVELNPIDIVSVDGRAGWIRFSDADIDMFPLEAAGLLNLPILFEHIVPYAGAGIGYYMFNGDGGDLDDEVGYFPLIGLEIGLHSLSLLAEARYVFLETDVRNGQGSLAGVDKVKLDGTAVNVGLLVRF